MDAWQLGEKAETWIYQKFQKKNATILEFGCGKGTEARSSSHQITVIEHDIGSVDRKSDDYSSQDDAKKHPAVRL